MLRLHATSEVILGAMLWISFAEIQKMRFICESERTSFVPPANFSECSPSSRSSDTLMNSRNYSFK